MFARKKSIILSLHLSKIRQVVQGKKLAAFDAEAVGGGAVGKQQILRLQGRMIAHGLVKDGLGEGHRGSLALHHHQGLAALAEDDGIGTLVQAVHLQRILHRHEARRHPEVLNEEIQHLLPYLFLRREDDETAAQRVEDTGLPLALLGAKPL